MKIYLARGRYLGIPSFHPTGGFSFDVFRMAVGYSLKNFADTGFIIFQSLLMNHKTSAPYFPCCKRTIRIIYRFIPTVREEANLSTTCCFYLVFSTPTHKVREIHFRLFCNTRTGKDAVRSHVQKLKGVDKTLRRIIPTCCLADHIYYTILSQFSQAGVNIVK